MSTKNTDSPYEPYVFALIEQIEQHLCGLDELSDLALKRPLTFNERSASERSLQVIVETAITAPDIVDMRGAVGMRNAIIHDYLNLDWSLIQVVLKQKKYHLIHDYVRTVTTALLKS